jgi:hypothetical protein
MNTTTLVVLLALALIPCGHAFDVEMASTERFKVSYVEPKKLPTLEAISKQFFGREHVLKMEQEAIASGVTGKELRKVRRIQLEYYYFPIRVTDSKTGNTYEVQKDRRTIIARTNDGKVIWKANPFEDGQLGPYRVEHPFIVYFGKSANAINAGNGNHFLGIAYNSSQFGQIRLADGSFQFGGND